MHFNLHKPIQIVFSKNFENCGSPFKNETLHQESSEDSKKTLEICNVQNIDSQVKAVVGAHMKEYNEGIELFNQEPQFYCILFVI